MHLVEAQAVEEPDVMYHAGDRNVVNRHAHQVKGSHIDWSLIIHIV
jgi:hypothetical protein